ncbi:hypothetical protein Tco_0040967 [Tanacetum coccineum]
MIACDLSIHLSLYKVVRKVRWRHGCGMRWMNEKMKLIGKRIHTMELMKLKTCLLSWIQATEDVDEEVVERDTDQVEVVVDPVVDQEVVDLVLFPFVDQQVVDQ